MKLIIIGAGPGGYETAVEARRKGLDVTLITAGPLGGTCLNEGCIPTKCFCHDAHRDTLAARSADALRKMVERKDGVVEQLRSGVETLLKGVEIVRGIARVADSHTVRVWPTEAESAAAERLDPEFSDCREFTADRIIIATGSHPAWLNVPGAVETPGVLSSSDMLRLTEIPERLTVIGGGVIGLEFASIFSSLGSKVTVIEYCKGILPHFDTDIAKRLRQSLVKSGVTILTGTEVTGISAGEETSSDSDPAVNGVRHLCGWGCESLENSSGEAGAKPIQIVFYKAAGQEDKTGSVVSDKVLMAVGRVPDLRVITGCKGIERERRGIKVDGNMQTTLPGVYAVGDVNGLIMLAHAAVAQGRVALRHILGAMEDGGGNSSVSDGGSEALRGNSSVSDGGSEALRGSGSPVGSGADFAASSGGSGIRLEIMPAAVFTVPEVASVGLTEEDCKAKGIAYRTVKSFYRANGKALAEEASEGCCKILVSEARRSPQPDGRSDGADCSSSRRDGGGCPGVQELKPGQILGCHILGKDAANLISEITALMHFGATVEDLGDIIHPHPSLSELFSNP